MPTPRRTGGDNNTASGDFRFAAGRNAHAGHAGGFVWGDGSQAANSTAANRFEVLASGGAIFYCGGGSVSFTGGGTWNFSSDRNLKENFAAVDTRTVLERVSAMPITRWNMKQQQSSQTHIGPMAQTFTRHLDSTETTTPISMILDETAVVLAAIQGLNQKVDEKDARIAALEKKPGSLENARKTLRQRGLTRQKPESG